MNSYGLPDKYKTINGKRLQSTGMFDTNETEVYFGDIVTYDDSEDTFEVVMRKGEIILNKLNAGNEPEWVDAYSFLGDATVVGNVFFGLLL